MKKLLTFIALALCTTSAMATDTMPARLNSCDVQVVQQAADAVLSDPKTLQEPFELFDVARYQRFAGRQDDAVFLYLLAQLRAARQAIFARDRLQWLATREQMLAPLIMPVIEANPELAAGIVQRVIDWDSNHPDPNRARARAEGGDAATQLARLDAELAQLPAQLRASERVPAARVALARADQEAAEGHAERCDPSKVDWLYLAAARETMTRQAEKAVRSAPLVLKQASGKIRSVQVVSVSTRLPSNLPVRMTAKVQPLQGAPFFAEIASHGTVTPQRKLGQVSISLLCLSKRDLGERPSAWTEVCVDDPAAIRP